MNTTYKVFEFDVSSLLIQFNLFSIRKYEIIQSDFQNLANYVLSR